jgi:hypothetical protein
MWQRNQQKDGHPQHQTQVTIEAFIGCRRNIEHLENVHWSADQCEKEYDQRDGESEDEAARNPEKDGQDGP